MAGRLTTEVGQVLHDGGTSNVRETAEAVQALHDGGPSSGRFTAEAVQVLYAVPVAASTGSQFRVMGFIG